MHIYLLPSDNKRLKARLKGSMQLLLTPSDNTPKGQVLCKLIN
jgi:hypothetical protein